MRTNKQSGGILGSAGNVFEPLEGRSLLSATPVTLATVDGSNGQPSAQVAVDAAGDVFGTTASSGTSAGSRPGRAGPP